jgi:acetyl-CoA carboxylase biotin carboxyl carrier protein
MAAHGLEEFEYEHGGLHIRLKKASPGGEQSLRAPAASKKSALPPSASAAHVPTGEEAAHEASGTSGAPAVGEEFHVIKSPIVGTFYSASSPEAPPFIKAGDTVRSGQVVCIIEAMKLMNEIEADVAGKVERVLVENGQPVEYGQPLFTILPAKK